MNALEQAEARLRAAMLAGDVDTLDALLTDGVIFTDQNGARLTKTDDLASYRSGELVIHRLDERNDRIVRELGDSAVVAVTVTIAGRFRGEDFLGTFAYTRLWHFADGRWRVQAAHCSMVTG